MVKRFLAVGLIAMQYIHLNACVIEKAKIALGNLQQYNIVIDLDKAKHNAYRQLLEEIDKNSVSNKSSSARELLHVVWKRICFTKIDGASRSDIRNALLGVLAVAQQVLCECIHEKKASLDNYGVRHFNDVLHGKIASFYSTYTLKIGNSPLTSEEEDDVFLSESSEDEGITSIKDQINNFVKTDEEFADIY